MSELPSGTVTFLFTDLEGSTRLWEGHPDAMPAALARHDQILDDAIAAHDGVVVKRTGDGVHAVFVTADDAVRAAVAAQRNLAAEHWDVIEPLTVRVGLHTGTAELRAGDYYGTTLNRAARLMSVAHGGQIVVSQITQQLVSDTVGEMLTSTDLGEHRSRDLATPMRVFQVTHEDLRIGVPEGQFA